MLPISATLLSSVACAIRLSRCAQLQVKAVGKDRLVLDLSCRKHEGQYHVATNRWQTISSLAVTPESLAQLAESCAEFLVHGIDKEGKQQGIDEDLVKLLTEHSPAVATYAGGVRSMVRFRAKQQYSIGQLFSWLALVLYQMLQYVARTHKHMRVAQVVANSILHIAVMCLSLGFLFARPTGRSLFCILLC